MAEAIRLATQVTAPTRATSDGRLYAARGTRTGELFIVDWLTGLAMQGRVFYAFPGAAYNSSITGVATAFSATTPDFTLESASGTTCMPLNVQMTQTGTVAGGVISVYFGYQNAIERSSSGTVFANILSSRTDAPYARVGIPYQAPTVATDTVGVRIATWFMKQDVATENSTEQINWSPVGLGTPIMLVGVSAFKIYTWAGTTAPTWFMSMAWAEIPSADVT